MEGLENPVYEPIHNMREREIPITKDDYNKTTSVEKMSVQAAQAELAKLMERGSPSSLMMSRESSMVLQRLIPILAPSSLQLLLPSVLGDFKTLSTNR